MLMTRRNWLHTSAAAAAGMVASPAAFGHQLSSASTGHWSSQSRLKAVMPPVLADYSMIKARLNANENPFGPSPAARLAIMEAVSMGNRYGHLEAAKLRKMIAEKEGVPEEYIMISPGSTDMLEKTAITHFVHGGNIVSADPAYMSLVNTAQAFSAEWRNVSLTKDYAHDLPAMEAAIDADTKLVYVCNPNNPTGTLTDAAALRAWCSRVSEKAPVFVDEAYLEYLDKPTASSMVDLVVKGKNLIIARTFSKIHAMAGLRIGYIVALPETLEKINKMVRGNMGLCITSIMGAIASMSDTGFHEDSRRWTRGGREFLFSELRTLGFDYSPSYTSFVLFPIQMEGKTFLEKMMTAGVGVRAFLIDGQTYCRVSVGKMDELKLFTEVLKKVLV